MKKLRFIRKFRNYAHACMAIKIGIMLHAFTSYEADTAKIKDATWDRIAVNLEVSKPNVISIEPITINLPAINLPA